MTKKSEKIENPSVFIGIPCFGGQMFATCVESLIQNMMDLGSRGIPSAFMTVKGESLIPRPRNLIAHKFLASSCDYLMFIDADVGYPATTISDLIATGEPLIGGSYPIKAHDPKRIIDAHEAGCKTESLLKYASRSVVQPKRDGINTITDTTVPFEVSYLGTGLMLIHRSIFESMIAADPDRWYYPGGELREVADANKQHIYDFFQCPITPDHEYLSEDYFFCYRAQKLGHRVMLAPWLNTTHSGFSVYQGSFITAQNHILKEDKND